MATIKLQPSGAVVIKEGKVSCACCAGPSECCMYPSEALVDGLYTVDDLPDEIIFTNVSINLVGVLLTKTGGNISFYEGYHNGDLLSVRIKNFIDLSGEERNVWILFAFGEEFGLSSRPECLFVTDDEFNGSYDTFADTYTVSGEPLGSVTLTRVSLCLWTGLDSCGNTVFLELFADPDDGRIWYLEFPHYISPCVLSETLIRSVENIGYGNTPVGGYGNEPYDEVVLSVS